MKLNAFCKSELCYHCWPLQLFGLIQQTTNWQFPFFPKKTEFDISYKLYEMSKIVFWGKQSEKYFSMSSDENFTQSAKR